MQSDTFNNNLNIGQAALAGDCLPRPAQQTAVVQVHQTEPHGGNSLSAQLNHALVNTYWGWIYIGCAPPT